MPDGIVTIASDGSHQLLPSDQRLKDYLRLLVTNCWKGDKVRMTPTGMLALVRLLSQGNAGREAFHIRYED